MTKKKDTEIDSKGRGVQSRETSLQASTGSAGRGRKDRKTKTKRDSGDSASTIPTTWTFKALLDELYKRNK